MYLHPDRIIEFALTKNAIEVEENLLLIVEYLLTVFDEEKARYASDNNVEIDPEEYSEMREAYAIYLADLLLGMRERCAAKQSEMEQEGTVEKALLFSFVLSQFFNIEDTEWSNSKQMAQLEVVNKVRLLRPAAKISKRWRAHSGACDKCLAMDGTEVPFEEPFLRTGQLIELSTGEEFIYNYIDRDIALLHPHDRCWVEFIIEY